MIWGAGAVTVTAVLAAGWPLMASARAADPPRRSATIAASAVVITTVTGVAVNGLVGLPAGVRALWALSTAGAACWLAVRTRGLAVDGLAGKSASGTDGDALSAQDDVVQALVVAAYALQMGDTHRASDAVDGALRRSRATLDALLREHRRRDLVRREPVQQRRTVADASASQP
ncbi:MFS transporter [Candidatus Protofrankia californiensis]|uniref:MFS transporter n=1 Tax=Candidatus Protofrankia californiensis TaxID=1839754 RepID=UPI0019CF7189|nr:MFS transporter [Candidatus Protofrankia californiensis]